MKKNAVKNTALMMAIIMLFAFIPKTFADSSRTVSRQEILDASSNLKVYIDTYCSLPQTVSVGKNEINLGQYFKLACDTVLNIHNGVNSDLTIEEVMMPQSPSDAVTAEMKIYITTEKAEEMGVRRVQDDYIDMSQRNSDFIEQYDLAANYCSYKSSRNSTIKVGFENLVYSWAKILNYYNENGALPNYVTVYSWAEISSSASTPPPTPTPVPTPTPHPAPMPDSVFSELAKKSALRVYTAIERNKELPLYATVGNLRFSMPSFLELMARIVVDTYNRTLTEEIYYYDRQKAQQSGEDTGGGILEFNEYASIAQSILDFCQAEGRAVSYVDSSIGKIGFETLVHTFSNIVAQMYASGTVLETVQVKSWKTITGTALAAPIPTQATVPVTPSRTPAFTEKPSYDDKSEPVRYVSKSTLFEAALRVKKTIEITKDIPAYITMGDVRISMPQLLSTLAIFVNDTSYKTVPMYAVDNCERTAESMNSGALTVDEYKTAAEKICKFVQYNMMVPSYVETALGNMSYESLLYLFCSIVERYAQSNTLPESITANSWKDISGNSLPTPKPTSEITPQPTPTPKPTAMPIPTEEVPSNIEGDTFKTGSVGTKGAVSSASAYASKIGLDILKAGGNAIDAAVATMFAVGLCEPSGSSVGGGGLATIYLADEDRYFVYDYMTLSPMSGASSSPQAKCLSVPGMVHGAISMLEKYGTMTLEEVLNPVIELARCGFIVGEEFIYRAGLIRGTLPYAVQTFTRDSEGGALQVGDTYRNEDLANTLEIIRDGGIDAFYKGEFTEKLVSYIRSIGGVITTNDFANYTSYERTALTSTYRGYKLYAGSGTAFGGQRVISMLGKMSNHNMASYGHDSADAVRAAAVGFGLTARGGSSLGVKEDILNLLDGVVPFDNKTTTMLVTYDKWGNAVAANVTLGDNFGSSVAVPGTGFCFNSCISDGASAARSPSTMAPVIVANTSGKPMIIVGSPGDQAIITATALTISNIIDFGMNACQAVNAPRFFGYASSSSMTLETRYSAETMQTLRNWGYSLTIGEGEYSKGVGCVAAIHIDDDGNIMSAADIRREYHSFAY